MCKVSIVIPVYNVEEYLSKCIESAVHQTFNDYEILLIDDGSKDKSPMICDQYASHYSNIHVIHQENRGLALARKTGINEANGEFIVFLDSDDWIHENMLKKLVAIAEKDKSSVVCCQFLRIDENGNITHECKMKEKHIICSDYNEFIYQLVVTRNIITSACCKLIRTDLLRKVNFPNNLAIGEEHDMVCQILDLVKQISIIPDEMYYYFTRKTSISYSGYNPKYYNSYLNYKKLAHHCIKKCNKLHDEINVFFAEYEMAIITAMCRNKVFDKKAISELQNTIKNNVTSMLQSKNTNFNIKFSAILIAFCPRLFVFLYSFYLKIHTF